MNTKLFFLILGIQTAIAAAVIMLLLSPAGNNASTPAQMEAEEPALPPEIISDVTPQIETPPPVSRPNLSTEEIYGLFLEGKIGAMKGLKQVSISDLLPASDPNLTVADGWNYDPKYSSYALINCAADEKPEMLLCFSGYDVYAPEAEDGVIVYVLTLDEGVLRMTYSYEDYTRSSTSINTYGLLRSEGSSGTGYQAYTEGVLDENATYQKIYTMDSLDGFAMSSICEKAYDEIFAPEYEGTSMEAYQYNIDGETFYSYSLENCKADEKKLCEAFISKCEEYGIIWSNVQEIEDLIQKRRDSLGLPEKVYSGAPASWQLFDMANSL